jgi:Zn-dependent metalloprotease
MRLSGRVILLFALSILIMAAFGTYFLINLDRQSRAAQASLIDTSAVSDESSVEKDATTTDISLYAEKGYLYKARSEDEAAVVEFLQKDPTYIPEDVAPDEQVKGVTTVEAQESTTPQTLIPKDFLQNSYLERKTKDEEDPYLKENGIYLNGQHFFYQQKIKGIPVFGGELAIHIKNKKEIYGVDGNLTTAQSTDTTSISEDKAREVALTAAAIEEKVQRLKVSKTEKYIFNEKVLGLSDNDVNNVTLAVTVEADKTPSDFAERYFVDLSNGKIVHKESLIVEALDREVYNCAGGVSSCPIARAEGQGPTSNTDVNNTFAFFGDTYNYYSASHGRDSYDNQGAPLVGLVNLTTQVSCPNAFWSGAGGYIGVCTGLAANDVLAHELTHAVIQNTADLFYANQSGALNESIADVFGWAVDSTDWTMGEDTTLGVIRSLADPTQSSPPQPDSLFSTNYYCGGLDNGGVHRNSGVFNKAFYLMTAGGTFNGCTVSGVTKAKSLPIVYRALTVYLTSSANFKDVNNKLIQSCQELYPGEVNTTCDQVKRALQATEMDQQPAASQAGASCSGTVRQTPQCANAVSPTPQPASAFDRAIELSGTAANPSYVQAPQNTLFGTPGHFSIEAFIKPTFPTSEKDSNISYIVYKDGVYTLKYQYRKLSNTQADINYYFEASSSLNQCQMRSVGKSVQLSYDQATKWTHILGEMRAGVMYLYIDGKLVANYGSANFDSVCDNKKPVKIGSNPADTNFGNNPNFPGQIDEVRIYGNSPTVAVPVLPYPSDWATEGLWHFDGSFEDISDYQYNGTSTGAIQFVKSTIPSAEFTPTPTRTPTPIPPTPTRTPTPVPSNTPTSVPNTPTPTRTPTPTPFPTATSTPTPIPSATLTPTPVCLKSQGDANCDGAINSADYVQWLYAFAGGASAQEKVKSDFNGDGAVNLVDFEILRRGVTQ